MIKKIIEIDSSKCIGCELCVNACHEGAIGMVDGVAKLLREDYCDGLGDCLPVCPTNAISFITKEVNIPNQKNFNFWPIQIKLVPVISPNYKDSLTIAATCCGFIVDVSKFKDESVVLIGCPKLDMVDYSLKLTEIFKNNDIKTVKIVRMEVPCCRGLEIMVNTAIKNSQKNIQVISKIISIDGKEIN